jgi:predicted phage terminase large subunit-like protein
VRAEVTKEELAQRKEEGLAKAAATRIHTQQEAARAELARRELARRHLLPFIHRFDPKYQAGWFHKDLCLNLEQFLQDVVEQKSPRLMLFVPPRHGKSVTVSQHFSAWAHGKYPELEFIQSSYAETLQTDFSKKIQEMVNDPEYQLLFPGVTIPKKHEAVARWHLALDGKLTGGGHLAAGVGGPLTGRGAHIGIIDDPLKNDEEADSEVTRNSNFAWYSSTFYTRLAPGGGVLIVQTRWHDDDLSGRLIRHMEEAEKEFKESGVWPADADRWKIISYPAIATEDEKYRRKGEALHPQRFSLELLKKTKRTLIPRHWSALYQQNPVAEEGAYFTREMLRVYQTKHRPPLSQLDIYCAADLAISTKETADYTVFVVAGLDKDDNLWILDVRRDRMDTDQIVDTIFDIHKTWKPVRFGIERDKVLQAIGSPINKRIVKEREYSLIIEPLEIGGRDKRTRARPLQGRMKQGKVLVPAEALWLEQWVNEYLRFDSGVNDDCVDAGAWLGQMLTDVTFRLRPAARKKKSWKQKLKTHIAKASGGTHMRA